MATPLIVTQAPDRIDWQRERVYGAEQQAECECADYDDWEYLTLDTVEPFVLRALAKAEIGNGTPPRFCFDIPDDSNFAGMYRGATHDIWLNPKILCPWTVLHELAHWVEWREPGHGPKFCSTMLELVQAGIGDVAADILRSAYAEFNVEVFDFSRIG